MKRIAHRAVEMSLCASLSTLGLAVLATPAAAADSLGTGVRVGGLCSFVDPIEIPAGVTAGITSQCDVVVITPPPANVTVVPLPGAVFVDDDPAAAAGFVTSVVTSGDGGVQSHTKIARSGFTKITVLEQFGITAYESQIDVSAQQDTETGQLSGGTYSGSCYASAFPGNTINSCFGRAASRSGSYVEAWARGDFDNVIVGPHIITWAQHDITATGYAGLCKILEGSLPPFWSMSCAIQRVH